jgi:hypothetical protein
MAVDERNALVILLYFALLFGCIGVLGVTQIYHYRRISNAIERQQIKWAVYGCATTIAGEFVLWLLTPKYRFKGTFCTVLRVSFSSRILPLRVYPFSCAVVRLQRMVFQM